MTPYRLILCNLEINISSILNYFQSHHSTQIKQRHPSPSRNQIATSCSIKTSLCVYQVTISCNKQQFLWDNPDRVERRTGRRKMAYLPIKGLFANFYILNWKFRIFVICWIWVCYHYWKCSKKLSTRSQDTQFHCPGTNIEIKQSISQENLVQCWILDIWLGCFGPKNEVKWPICHKETFLKNFMYFIFVRL